MLLVMLLNYLLLLEKKLFKNGCYPLDSLLAQCFPLQTDFDPMDSSPVLILS